MKTFVSKIRGIKFYYAGHHIVRYKPAEWLLLYPDPNNEHDPNAIKIFDTAGNHLGFVASEDNKFVFSIISKHEYFCAITKVYYDYEKPSIEYVIAYKEPGESAPDFEDIIFKYKALHSMFEDEEIDDIFGDIEIKKHKTKKTEADKIMDFNNGCLKLKEGFYEDAYNLFEPLAEEDKDPYALYFCGYMLYEGKGVARNFKKSFDYFCLAKEKGLENADFRIGCFYENGIVVKKDIKKAIQYYKKAAYENRCFEALHRLASMYFTGIGMECNIEKFYECINLVLKYNSEIEESKRGK